MQRYALIFSLAFCLCSLAEARTWRPKDKPPVTGEFLDVKGDNVRVQTAGGITEIPYLILSRTDKAAVKSTLQQQGKNDEAVRLNNLERGGGSGAAPKTAIPGMGNSLPGLPGGDSNSRNRTWRDVNGNELQAEFVGVAGPNVQLRVNGTVQEYPIIGFSAPDQQWITEHQNDTPPPEEPARIGGSLGGGMTPPGMPGGMAPPSMPGTGVPGPGMPGSGRMPGPGMMPPGMPGGGMMPPGMPGRGMMPQMPGAMGPPTMGAPPSMPGMPAMPGASEDPFPGTAAPPGGNFPGAPTGMGMPGPQMPQIPDMTPPPMSAPPTMSGPPNIPGFSRHDDTLQCENCGAEFTAADGLKEGDECPKCSGGSGGYSFRSTRGLVKGVVFLVVMAAGAVGWVIRKISGSN